MKQVATDRRIAGRLIAMAAMLLIVVSGCTPKKPAESGAFKVGKPYQVAGQWYYPKIDYGYEERGLASWYGPNFHGKPTANGETFDMRKVSAAHKTLPLPSVVRVTNLENGRSIVVRINDRGPFIRGRIIDLSKRAAELLGFADKGTAMVEVRIEPGISQQAALAAGAGNDPKFGPPPPKAAPSIDVSIENLKPVDDLEAFGGGSGQPVRVATPGPVNRPPYDGVTSLNTRGTAPSQGAQDDQPAPGTKVSVDIVPVAGSPAIYVQAGAFAKFHNANRLRARLYILGQPVQVTQVYVTNQPMFRVRVGPLLSVEAADRTLDRMVAAGYPDAQIVID